MDDRAVVVGAGVAGLAAAQVLSGRYDQVVVLDRDALPPEPEPRRGAPQGSAPHILLVAGRQALAKLFPGFEEELVEVGGTRFDTGLGLCTSRLGRRWPAAPTGMDLVAVSRPRLEAVLRDRVAALPNVELRDRVAVSALAGDASGVTGVVLDTGETLDARLVVDCSGRGARSDRWLAALGFETPAPIEVKVGVAYASRVYRRRTGDLPDWQAAFVLPTAPQQQMTGVVLPIEGDRWLMSIGGWHLADPPADAAALERCARALPDPIVAEVMSRAEPLGDVVVTRFPSSRRRLFEQLSAPAPGYVALGDAVCSVNPVYGQGMTCAALSAGALGNTLDRHGRTMSSAAARDYYAEVAGIVGVPWRFAVGGDFVFPQTTGPRPRGIALRNWYSRRISYASQIDSDINRAFVRVQHLVDPPSVLMRPAFVARVLRQARRRRREDT